jgi:amidophosphoribosyltransferase
MEEIRRYLDADSIGYLSEHGMVQSTGKPHDDFCMACYNGKYPVPYHSSVDKEIIERRQFEAQSFGDLLEKEKSQSKLI